MLVPGECFSIKAGNGLWPHYAWWLHNIETFSVLLTLSLVREIHRSPMDSLTKEFWCFVVGVNKLLSKQWGDRRFRFTELQLCVPYTVYPKKYAYGLFFAVLCCGYTLTDFPISIRLTSLALWQSNDCPSASKATLMNMDKYFMWTHYERLHNHNKAKHSNNVCIFLGIYCNMHTVSLCFVVAPCSIHWQYFDIL